MSASTTMECTVRRPSNGWVIIQSFAQTIQKVERLPDVERVLGPCLSNCSDLSKSVECVHELWRVQPYSTSLLQTLDCDAAQLSFEVSNAEIEKRLRWKR